LIPILQRDSDDASLLNHGCVTLRTPQSKGLQVNRFPGLRGNLPARINASIDTWSVWVPVTHQKVVSGPMTVLDARGDIRARIPRERSGGRVMPGVRPRQRALNLLPAAALRERVSPDAGLG
jgi:hypothetical protein